MSSAVRDAPARHPGVHSCGRYASLDDMVVQAVTFFRDGFARRERCVLVTGRDREQVKSLVSARVGRDGGAEVIDLSEVYARAAHPTTGEVEPSAMTGVWQSMIDESLRSGTTGLRVVAEVDSLVRDECRRAAFLDYERSIGGFIVGRPMSALCLYPDDVPSANEFAEFACVHDDAPRDSSTFRLYLAEPGVLRISGEVDALDRGRFTAALERVGLGDSPTPVLDLSELDFIDHGGVAALDEWARRHDRDVEVRGQRPLVERLIELVGATRLVIATGSELRDV